LDRIAVALVQEFKITDEDRTTTNYDHIVQRLDIDSNPPAGLITHTAGWDEQARVFRIVAIWSSPDEAQTFMRDQRLHAQWRPRSSRSCPPTTSRTR
jgi:hypothetical protein